MKKNIFKNFIYILFVLMLVVMPLTSVYAAQIEGSGGGGSGSSGTSFLDSIFSEGGAFQNGSKDQNNNAAAKALENALKGTIGQFTDTIFYIGNYVFIMAAIVLGIKYIMNSSQGKADIKTGMANLLVGAVFFYSAQIVFNFAYGSFKEVFEVTSAASMMGKIFGTFVPVAQIASFAAIAFVGLKYMFADSKEKSKIKQQMVPFAVGVMLVFSTTSVLNFVIRAANDVLR